MCGDGEVEVTLKRERRGCGKVGGIKQWVTSVVYYQNIPIMSPIAPNIALSSAFVS